MEEDDTPSTDVDANMLDEEYPPEALGSQSPGVQTKESNIETNLQKASILQQLNKRKQSLGRSMSESELPKPKYSSEQGSPMVSESVQGRETLDEIIKLHQNHIKDCSNAIAMENMLLKQVKEKLDLNSDNEQVCNHAVTKYLHELDNLLLLKAESARKICEKIRQHYQR